jgi:hypothetical protein
MTGGKKNTTIFAFLHQIHSDSQIRLGLFTEGNKKITNILQENLGARKDFEIEVQMGKYITKHPERHYQCMDWIYLAKDRFYWQTLLNTLIKCRI